MANLKGTETEKNVLKAFAGESQARNRYTMFSAQAKNEGMEQIAEFFTEAAENEREHAKKFFKFLEGGMLEITATFPAGKIGTTLENLLASAGGEKEEYTEIYPSFAETAEKEGFKDIAIAFKLISKIEREHETKFRKLAENIEKNQVFAKGGKVKWKCRKCGHVHEHEKAPELCPLCGHEKAFFEIAAENY